MPLAGLSDPAGGEPGTVGPGAAVDPAGGAAGLAEAAACAGLPGLRCLGLYRQVLLRGSRAFRGLRHDERGWQLWSAGSGWQAVQLRPDSLALPWLIVLRVRLPGRWRILAAVSRPMHWAPTAIGACVSACASVAVDGRHQDSVAGFGQQVRIIQRVVQAPAFAALHGRADDQFGDQCQVAQLDQVAADLVVAVELVDLAEQQAYPVLARCRRLLVRTIPT